MVMITTGHAMEYIRRHDHDCYITPEGVTAVGLSVMGDNVMQYVADSDDNWFEELQAFPIVNGMVDITPIKQWLGY